jgi:hypothetical protein
MNNLLRGLDAFSPMKNRRNERLLVAAEIWSRVVTQST